MSEEVVSEIGGKLCFFGLAVIGVGFFIGGIHCFVHAFKDMKVLGFQWSLLGLSILCFFVFTLMGLTEIMIYNDIF